MSTLSISLRKNMELAPISSLQNDTTMNFFTKHHMTNTHGLRLPEVRNENKLTSVIHNRKIIFRFWFDKEVTKFHTSN